MTIPTNLHRPPRKCQPAPVAILAIALRNAMKDIDASTADVAKWVGVDHRTVKRWLARGTPVAIEKLMTSRRLWPVMLDHLFRAGEATLDVDLGLSIEVANG